MRVIQRDVFNCTRPQVWRLYPLGDIHLGNIACHEKELERMVQHIAADPQGYWVGMGDYCEWIQRRDNRYSENSLALWLRGHADLVVLPNA